MSWKEWSAVAVVIGGGILLQIPSHDVAEMDHGAMDQGKKPVMLETQGTFSTVALDVTGMT